METLTKICALYGDRRHVPPRALLRSCPFSADVDMEIGVDPDGDGGDGDIDGYYDYYHTRTMGDGRVGDIFDCGDSRHRHRHWFEDS